MKKVSLEVTLEQASAAAKALDLLSRVLIGQFNIVAELFRHDEVVVRDETTHAGGRALTIEEVEHAEALCEGLKRILGLERGASFGIGHRAVSKDAHRAYEVLCVLRQALAVERSPNGNSVHHDGLRLRYTDDPAPKAVVTGEDVAHREMPSRATVLTRWSEQQNVRFVSRSHGQSSTETISRDALLALVDLSRQEALA